jgi:hypothetical protein
MSLSLTGLPALIFLVGFVVVFSAPVWLAARIIGAKHPTLLRAVASLAAGMLGSFLLAVLIGPWVFLLAPLGFLLSFKYILGTSLLGSVLLAIVAGLGYAAMGYFIGGGILGIPEIPVGGQGITV